MPFSNAPHEVLLRQGRVIDPSQGLDQVRDVRFLNGVVAEIGLNLTAGVDADVRNVTGMIVTPGLIDLHTHVYWGGTSIGVDPIALARQSSTATLADAGTSGAGNLLGFRKHVIEPSAPLRILPLLNISFPGIFAFSRSVRMGECEDLRLLDMNSCISVAREHADLVVGIKVRVGRGSSGTRGVAPLDMAIEVAEVLGLPVMAHIDYIPPTRTEVLSRLRKGDILTHCFKPPPNAPTTPDGAVRGEVQDALARGVIFDIGHGGGSCSFATSRAMLKAGIQPDVISSDVHLLSANGPAIDLLHTLAKFHVLGMSLYDVIACATLNAARAIRRPALGTLKPGIGADASIFKVLDQPTLYKDAAGESLLGNIRFEAHGLVLAGRWW
ncbi:MAG: amidohydrolase/deacetylase family metallohydrolase [Burkholderiales bacterium]|nr:amidohydrolase/deacetylase family metallohydrolase [Burkholderiales bacterium]